MIQTEAFIQIQDFVLEPLLPLHAEKLFQATQSEQLYTFIPQNPPLSVQALAKKYAYWAGRKSPDGREIWLNYAIFSQSLTAYVGTLQATILEDTTTYLAYEIFPAYWRKGFATIACTGFIQYLFQTYPIQTITAHVDTRNRASYKLLESLGFRQTQFIQHADEFKGLMSDEFVYELNKI